MEPTNDLVTAACKAAHAVHRVWCESLGDGSHVHLDKSTPEDVATVRACVRATINLLAVSGTSYDDISRYVHEAWMEKKLADGWRYGPTKSSLSKEHPCIVPYSDLPPEQRVKDEIFCTVVAAIARAWWKRPS